MADVKVRLSGYLPAAEMDGLQQLLQGLVREPKERRLIIGVIDTATRRDHGDGEYEPTVRILQVEAPQGELREEARALLRRAYAQRTGATQVFEDDGTDSWGIGGQAGKPLNPEQPAETPLGDQPADPDAAEWESPAEDDDLDAAVAAAQVGGEEEPFQSPEPPQPVQDQVAAKRGRKSTTTTED
jgi:hypothetical protein